MYRYYEICTPFRIKGVCTAFEFNWARDRVFKGESHDFWELVTVLSGQVEVVEDDRSYLLGGGEMICHAPNEFHRIRSAGGTRPHFLVLSFFHEGELPESIGDGVFLLNNEDISEYLGLFSPLKEYYDIQRAREKSGENPINAPISAQEGMLRLERFLLSLSRLCVSDKRLLNSVGAKEYRDLVRVLTERVRDNISLSELAASKHISESYVKKLFRTYAGEGAMAYYSRLRINEIKRMLERGISVTEISEEMNFSSSAYLSAFFKKHTGITPSEYGVKR